MLNQDHATRREFLTRFAAIGGLAAAGGLTGSLGQAAERSRKKKRAQGAVKIRIGSCTIGLEDAKKAGWTASRSASAGRPTPWKSPSPRSKPATKTK